MKYLSVLVLSFTLAGCVLFDPCSQFDCASGHDVLLQIVDDNNNYLGDAVNIKAKDGSEPEYFGWSNDKYLVCYVVPGKPYVASYNGRSTEFTVIAEQTGDGCCGPIYTTTEVNTTKGKAEPTPIPDDNVTVYLIKL